MNAPTPNNPFDNLIQEGVESSFVHLFERMARAVHQTAVDKGWWDTDRNDGEMIALEHSELSEFLEALRHGNPPSEHIPEFSAAEEEIADVIIRLMDHGYSRGWRVGLAIVAKMRFNATRPVKHGGKKF